MKFLPDWFRRDRIERDIDAELAFHVEAHARDLVSEGVPPEEARRLALATFGGLGPIRELTRDARGGRWLEDLLSDLRYAVRSLRHQPAVAMVAILTLTLGIGANTAIFSMMNGLLLRPLPVRDPGRLVLFSASVSEGTRTSTPPPSGRWDLFFSEAYEYLRSQSLPLKSIGAFGRVNRPLHWDCRGNPPSACAQRRTWCRGTTVTSSAPRQPWAERCQTTTIARVSFPSPSRAIGSGEGASAPIPW